MHKRQFFFGTKRRNEIRLPGFSHPSSVPRRSPNPGAIFQPNRPIGRRRQVEEAGGGGLGGHIQRVNLRVFLADTTKMSNAIPSMYGIFTYIFMVNVGKYTIHGSYGNVRR